MKSWLPARSISRRCRPRRNVLARCLIGAAAAAAAIYCVIFCSGVFTVREVRFAGASTVSRETLAGIEKGLTGTNVLTLSESRVAGRFKKYPEVKGVVLTRHLFGTLDCRVVRREPVALLACGGLIEVDGDGVLIPKRAGAADIDLPLITGIDEGAARRPEGEARIARAIGVLSAFKELGFLRKDRVSEIHVDGDEIDLVWAQTGTLVKLGRGDYAERVRTLGTIYGVFNSGSERAPDVIDLRFDRQVVIR
jgi:cell division septal protein FtsQ